MTENLRKRADRRIVGLAIASWRRTRSRLVSNRAGTLASQERDAQVQQAEHRAEDILREAEREAETTRRDAVESARRVLERIDALERPLGELVMTLREEVGRVVGEIEAPVDAESVPLPAAEDDGPAGGPARPPTPEPAYAAPSTDIPPVPLDPRPEPQSEPAPKGEPSPPPVNPPQTPRGPAGAQPAALSPEPAGKPRRERRRIFSRLRSGGEGEKGAFITAEGNCAVCQKAFMAGSEENLRTSGWRVSGDVGLCPDCQNDRWQLPEGARLPFRSGSG